MLVAIGLCVLGNYAFNHRDDVCVLLCAAAGLLLFLVSVLLAHEAHKDLWKQIGYIACWTEATKAQKSATAERSNRCR